jgi:hypothetical protein
LEKWTPGQKWPGPSAEEHNAVVDMARAFRGSSLPSAGEAVAAASGVGTTALRVANYSGVALLPGGVVAVRDIVIAPATDSDSFRRQALPKAYTPTSVADDNRTIGVVLDGCGSDDGSIAQVVIWGAVVCKIIAGDETSANSAPKFLKTIAGDASAAHPTADAGKSFARVIYSPAASSTAYGLVIVGGCRTEVAELNDSGHPWGIYWRDSCEGVWHKVIDLGLGDCLSSNSGSGGGGGSGCSTSGYSPGAGWTSGGPFGSYAASFFNDTSTTPPAPPPSGSWVFTSPWQWYAPACNWVAYGAFAAP